MLSLAGVPLEIRVHAVRVLVGTEALTALQRQELLACALWPVGDELGGAGTVQPRMRKWSPDTKRWAVEQHRQGMTEREIADRLGASRTTVRMWLRDGRATAVTASP